MNEASFESVKLEVFTSAESFLSGNESEAERTKIILRESEKVLLKYYYLSIKKPQIEASKSALEIHIFLLSNFFGLTRDEALSAIQSLFKNYRRELLHRNVVPVGAPVTKESFDSYNSV